MNIQENLLTINEYSRPGTPINKIEKLVIHWVGNAGSSAIANRNYFESLKDKDIYASSHYIIGLDGEIIQCIPESEYAYHAGNYEMNGKSIGIENCHPDWDGKFNDKTYESLIELLTELCQKYSLDQNAIIRHYDVTGKVCPKYYVEHEDEFEKIKQDVANKLGISYIAPEQTNQEQPEQDSNNSNDVYKIIMQGVNKRSQASLNSSVVEVLPKNKLINVYDQENGFYKTDNGYVRLGFAEKVSSANAAQNNENVPSTGNYKVNTPSGMKVRTGPGTNYAQVPFNSLTASAQKQGGYKYGVEFTALEVRKSEDGQTKYWARTPSGWVCLDWSIKV